VMPGLGRVRCGKDYGYKRVWEIMSEIGLRLESKSELYVVFELYLCI
jgi:hypothetical protein